ncbi:Meiotically up-regulated gene 157 protein [Coccomyxa sp. Obi]|nr:Meiotically up-regulated gene 157 protein [Coccomyxa sp. Obi]
MAFSAEGLSWGRRAVLCIIALNISGILVLLTAQLAGPSLHWLRDWTDLHNPYAFIKVRVRYGVDSSTSIIQHPELWARGVRNGTASGNLTALLTAEEQEELIALCGRCLYNSLTRAIKVKGSGDMVFVATGDIDDMWIRDSAVQLSIYFPRITGRPALRRVIEGGIRAQAFYILQDPYANAYTHTWRERNAWSPSHRRIGRGGWVATRNYELDSGAYFINMLWNYYTTPGLFAAERFLNETMIVDAVALMVRTWQTEQHHERDSDYRYSELLRDGKGPKSNYTGMSWSGYRPSDDPQVYGYNVPVNMYAAGALERAVALNERVWRSAGLGAHAARLADDIRQGIEKWGVVTMKDGTRVYAYEVDGMGNSLLNFDDPNVPSLLSIPLLGYAHYDPEIYAATRARILSPANAWYFEGSALRGLGSPHTPHSHVWPLAMSVQGLTTEDAEEQALLLRQLLATQCGTGLMHESVHVSSPEVCTRPWFEWANAMAVVFIENALGNACDDAAEEQRRAAISERENLQGGRSADETLFYETLEAGIQHITHKRKIARHLA